MDFVPDNVYWSRIIRALNPVSFTRTYINKSLYPVIFKGLRQPEILVNCIDGMHYDAKMDRVAPSDVVKIIQRHEDDVILKATKATSGGRGVTKIRTDATTDDVNKAISAIGSNYICQGVIRQSQHTAVFNESSLNTFRVNTLNINGTTTCECIMMRHGRSGSIVDNFAAGGIVCGMDKKGNFNGNNYDGQLKRVSQLPDGTPYSDHSVPNITDVIHCAIEAHQKFMPHIGHAAWDFAIDEKEEPVMIEVNLMLPGIITEQLTSSGSIFGNRTQEVINHAIKKNRSISWSEFVGGWE